MDEYGVANLRDKFLPRGWVDYANRCETFRHAGADPVMNTANAMSQWAIVLTPVYPGSGCENSCSTATPDDTGRMTNCK